MRPAALRTAIPLLLGLPAALLAHALAFEGQHSAGGSHHAALVDAALATVSLSAFAMLAMVRRTSEIAATGTVVAERLARLLPPWPWLFLATAGWLWVIELLEAPHSGSAILLACAVGMATLLVSFAGKAMCHALASIMLVCAARTGTQAPRAALLAPTGFQEFLGRLDRVRLFSRPPPIR